MIEAVLWDFGGVLTTSPFEAFNRYEAERGIPRDFIRTINATNPESNAWAKFESSEVTLEEFDRLFAEESEAAGYRIPGREVIELLSGDIRPRMVDVLRECKRRFRVGCITNNVKGGQGPGMASSSDRASRVAEVMALFDLVVESSVEGIRKPNPRIYEIACQRLEVAPERSVYLDDLGINLKPARALGMHTIKVIDEAQAIDELGEVLSTKY
ncbi:MAG: HAD-IA family hydrolase [Pseudomonadota bacterium]